MTVPKESVFTCAGCGRSFKATIDTKVFKCASCQDVINTVDDSARAQPGKIVCGSCWSGTQLRDQLWKTSEALFGETQPGEAEQHSHDNSAVIAELEAHLAIASEGRVIALRERDLAQEVRQKLERTLGDFLAKFATAREAELKVMKERDAALEASRALKQKNSELETQVALAEETANDALSERNAFAESQLELEDKVAELECRLMEPEASAAPLKARGSSARMASFADARINDLQLKLEAAQAELARFKQESEEHRGQLRAKVADLHGDLVAEQIDKVQFLAEKDMAVAAHHEAAAKVEDLNARLAKIQEAQAALTKNLEEAQRTVAREQEEAQKAKAQLATLREAAISSLEPMSAEINSALKALSAEADAIQKSAQTPETVAALQRLNEQMTAVRRQLVGRIAMVMGVPVSDSQEIPAVTK